MTTFTLRASEETTARLTSAEMRLWLHDFICNPHPLPPDPGSGYGRVSLTLPADAVNVVAGYSKSAISSALRRIAAERLGSQNQSGPRAYGADQTTDAIPISGRSHDNSQSGSQIAGLLIFFITWILTVGISIFVVLSSKKKVEPQDKKAQLSRKT
jgi:hypothetical protein